MVDVGSTERPRPRVLLVEDEKNIGATLRERLQKEGYEAVWSQTAEDARLQLTGAPFDLAILDVGLPDGNGFEIAAEIRSRRAQTALIFLTAFGSPEERVRGLELGAEDYIVKPFYLKELMLRIQNGLRRSSYLQSPARDSVRIGKALVHFSRFEAEVDGSVISLTHKEAAVLRLLVERAGRVVSRDEILNEVWASDEFPSPRTVDNFILRLRKWVEFDPENPQAIRSVRGVGYQWIEKTEE